MNKISYYLEMVKALNSPFLLPKFFNYVKYKIKKPLPVTPLTRYSPQIVHVMMTNRCNLKCSYCNASKSLEYGKDSSRQEMTLENMRQLFATPLLKNALLVDLLGGEPLLLDELEDIILLLSKAGHLTNTSTNGLLLPERIKGLKRAGISRINVSIYPANLKHLHKYLASINQNFRVHTSFVLLRSQLENKPNEIMDVIDFSREANSKSLRFWMYRPMGTNADSKEIIPDDLRAYKDFVQRATDKYRDFILWPSVVSRSKTPKKRCRQPWQHIGIGVNGEIGVCCGSEKQLDSDYNIFHTPSEKIYNHPEFVALREQLLSPNSSVPAMCQDCNLLEDGGW